MAKKYGSNDQWNRDFDAWKATKTQKLKPTNSLEKIEEGLANITSDIKEIPHKIEKSLDLKHRPRLKLFLTIIAYLIPLIVLGIVLSYIFAPFTAASSLTYTVDVATKEDMDTGKPLYLEESKALSPPVQYGNQTYREIVKTVPFYINFKSPVKIPKDSKTTLSMEFIGTNADLIVDKKLLFPSLENYELAKEFSDSYVYKRKDIIKKEGNEENAKDFLINNYYGSSVYSYLPLESNYQVDGYEKKETIIPNTFRGDLNFVFYTENGLSLDFEKQDMNWYAGEDNYTVIVKDMNETIVYSGFVGDDGNINDQRVSGEIDQRTVDIPNLTGPYYLGFESGGKKTDSTIKNIKINTNKIMFHKQFLVLDPMSFYVKNSFAKNIEFYYWHPDKDQIITINEDEVYLSKEYDGIIYNHPIRAGEYELSVEKGDLVINNNFIALTSANWIDIDILNQRIINNPDFIILDKKIIVFTNKGFIIYTDLTTSEDQRIELLASKKNEFNLRKVEVEIS